MPPHHRHHQSVEFVCGPKDPGDSSFWNNLGLSNNVNLSKEIEIDILFAL